MATTPLTAIEVKNAKPGDPQGRHRSEGYVPGSPYKMQDGGGMYLLVKPTGSKLWQMFYRFDGKQKTLSLGAYDAVSLTEAREKREEARRLLKNGSDPGEVMSKRAKKLQAETEAAEKKKAEEQVAIADAAKSKTTFKAIANEWMERNPPRSESTASKNRWLLGFAFDAFGDRQIDAIDSADVLDLCTAIEDSGRNETARRVKVKCGQVFRYAIGTRRLKNDPTAALSRALKSVIVTHRAAITDPKKVAVLMRDIDSYKGTMTVRCALQLSPLVFVRPGELRAARWADIDFDTGLWSFTPPKTRNQTGVELIIPLPSQAIAILKQLHQLTGDGPFVFASWGKSGHLSESAVLNGLRRMGYDTGEEMSGHGFRAMARTILEEVLKHRPEVIEQQLGHKIKDANGRAYNRTKNLDERKLMLQEWADYLDRLKAGAEVIPLRGSAA